ncbi:hypothetical protein G6F57_018956 [Rhizopus arrhizus]|nr:hypothetical protein G6F57_018956 [Rhizopus arrhizus]
MAGPGQAAVPGAAVRGPAPALSAAPPAGALPRGREGRAGDRLLPHCQGNGLGSAMIRCLQQASAARRRALCLHVQIHNPGARRLYERLGFIASDASGSSLHVAMRWNPLA